MMYNSNFPQVFYSYISLNSFEIAVWKIISEFHPQNSYQENIITLISIALKCNTIQNIWLLLTENKMFELYHIE